MTYCTQAWQWVRRAPTTCSVPTGERNNLSLFFKSKNAHKAKILPNCHSRACLILLVSILKLCWCGVNTRPRWGRCNCGLRGYAGSPWEAQGSAVRSKKMCLHMMHKTTGVEKRSSIMPFSWHWAVQVGNQPVGDYNRLKLESMYLFVSIVYLLLMKRRLAHFVGSPVEINPRQKSNGVPLAWIAVQYSINFGTCSHGWSKAVRRVPNCLKIKLRPRLKREHISRLGLGKNFTNPRIAMGTTAAPAQYTASTSSPETNSPWYDRRGWLGVKQQLSMSILKQTIQNTTHTLWPYSITKIRAVV